MPFHIKMVLTIMVGLVAVGGWVYMNQLGEIGPRNALLFLGPFTMLSLWVFPEVMRKPSDAKTPKHKIAGSNR